MNIHSSVDTVYRRVYGNVRMRDSHTYTRIASVSKLQYTRTRGCTLEVKLAPDSCTRGEKQPMWPREGVEDGNIQCAATKWRSIPFGAKTERTIRYAKQRRNDGTQWYVKIRGVILLQ